MIISNAKLTDLVESIGRLNRNIEKLMIVIIEFKACQNCLINSYLETHVERKEALYAKIAEKEKSIQTDNQTPKKSKRGRPRKTLIIDSKGLLQSNEITIKRKRGRPKKYC